MKPPLQPAQPCTVAPHERSPLLRAFVALSALLWIGCSSGDPGNPVATHSVHSLSDLLSRAHATRSEANATAWPADARILDVARGIATVRVLIDSERETTLPTESGVHVSWPLPLAVAPGVEAGRTGPHLLLTPPGEASETVRLSVETSDSFAVALRDPQTLPAPLERPLIWLDGSALHAYGRKHGAQGAVLELTYPTSAARLAGRTLEVGLDHGPRLDQLLLGREDRGGDPMTNVLAMWLEAGTDLELNLDDFAGGWLTGSLQAESSASGSAAGLRVVTTSPDGTSTTQTATASGATIALELPTAPTQARVTLSAFGPPGALLRLDEARIEREVAAPRPNVLLIVVDTLRADRLDSFGGTLGLTPNLDALAADSLRFTEYWATSCWTLPTISTMLTSVHMEVHGGKDKQSPIDPEIETLATVLRDAGYRTEAITEGGLFKSLYNLDRGFERFTEHHDGLKRGVDLARQFFAERAPQQDREPWFLTLHSYEVHEPYTPDPALVAKVRAQLPPELAAGIERPTDFIHLFEEGRWDDVIAADVPELMEELHNAEVRSADFLIGKLLDELERDGHLDNTLIVFTADHGEEFGEHGMLGHSDALYPELLHIPLMLRFPDGYRAGEADARPSSQLHMTPTVLDAVGLLESAREAPFQGRSLLREGEDLPVYAWRYRENGESLWTVRSGDMLFIQGEYVFERDSTGVEGVELYDLSSDPGALRDLDAVSAEQLESFQRLMEQVRAEYAGDGYEARKLQLDAATKQNLGDLGYL